MRLSLKYQEDYSAGPKISYRGYVCAVRDGYNPHVCYILTLALCWLRQVPGWAATWQQFSATLWKKNCLWQISWSYLELQRLRATADGWSWLSGVCKLQWKAADTELSRVPLKRGFLATSRTKRSCKLLWSSLHGEKPKQRAKWREKSVEKQPLSLFKTFCAICWSWYLCWHYWMRLGFYLSQPQKKLGSTCLQWSQPPATTWLLWSPKLAQTAWEKRWSFTAQWNEMLLWNLWIAGWKKGCPKPSGL